MGLRGDRLCVVADEASKYDGEGEEIEPVRGDMFYHEGEDEGVDVRGEEGEVEHGGVSCLEEQRRPAVHHRQALGPISWWWWRC